MIRETFSGDKTIFITANFLSSKYFFKILAGKKYQLCVTSSTLGILLYIYTSLVTGITISNMILVWRWWYRVTSMYMSIMYHLLISVITAIVTTNNKVISITIMIIHSSPRLLVTSTTPPITPASHSTAYLSSTLQHHPILGFSTKKCTSCQSSLSLVSIRTRRLDQSLTIKRQCCHSHWSTLIVFANSQRRPNQIGCLCTSTLLC